MEISFEIAQRPPLFIRDRRQRRRGDEKLADWRWRFWQELEIGVGFDLGGVFRRTLSDLLDRRFETFALGHIAKNHEQRRRTSELRGRGHRRRFDHPLDAVEG